MSPYLCVKIEEILITLIEMQMPAYIDNLLNLSAVFLNAPLKGFCFLQC